MMPKIQTERLTLIALTEERLSLYLTTPQQLEQALGLPVSRQIITEPLHRAIASSHWNGASKNGRLTKQRCL